MHEIGVLQLPAVVCVVSILLLIVFTIHHCENHGIFESYSGGPHERL